MAEEHRCQAPPEGHRHCANNCGFFGSLATLNLCSKCYRDYRDYRLKEDQASSAKIAVEKSLVASSSTSSALPPSVSATPLSSLKEEEERITSTILQAPVAAAAAEQQQPSRCTACRKRVGLTGFKCRCGQTYCASHRHPEQHTCTFDFKAAGRDAIARANPVVKADKLDKI